MEEEEAGDVEKLNKVKLDANREAKTSDFSCVSQIITYGREIDRTEIARDSFSKEPK